MGERLAGHVEARLQRLEASVAELHDRVRRLEAAPAGSPGEATGPPFATRHDVRHQPGSQGDPIAVVSLVGRLLLVGAGAYFLRALTDASVVPAAVGVLAGLAYAVVWVGAADRAAASGKRLSATFHAAAPVAIAYPLVWEAQVRFALVSPAGSAAALTAITAGLLVLAWRRHLHAVAWLVTMAGLAAASGLIVETAAVVPFAVYLIALGIGTLWLGYVRGWIGLRWPVAIAADIAVLGATSRGVRPVPLDPIASVLLLQLLLPTTYLSTIAARTLWLGRKVIPFEVIQAMAALVVGLGGALALTRVTGVGEGALGAVALVLGAAAYGVAFAFVDRRQRGGANFYFYTSLALALVVTGVCVLLAGDPRAHALAALGVCAAWAGRHYGRATLSTHAVAALVAAAAVGGTLESSTRALFGPGGVAPVESGGWIVVLAAAASLLVAFRPAVGDGMSAAHLPRLAMAAVIATCAGGLTVATTASWLSGMDETGLSPAAIATLRSGVLAVAALVLAALGQRTAAVEFRWLVYPVLAAGGLKLLLEDLRLSPPSMLVVALGAYGAALIVAPRLARRGGRELQRARAVSVETSETV
jgi:hypothetical protein